MASGHILERAQATHSQVTTSFLSRKLGWCVIRHQGKCIYILIARLRQFSHKVILNDLENSHKACYVRFFNPSFFIFYFMFFFFFFYLLNYQFGHMGASLPSLMFYLNVKSFTLFFIYIYMMNEYAIGEQLPNIILNLFHPRLPLN